jgi:hypothetical protein
LRSLKISELESANLIDAVPHYGSASRVIDPDVTLRTVDQSLSFFFLALGRGDTGNKKDNEPEAMPLHHFMLSASGQPVICHASEIQQADKCLGTCGIKSPNVLRFCAYRKR